MGDTHINFCLCILTFNPGDYAREQALAISMQGLKPNRIVVIDSASDDGSVESYCVCNAEIIGIKRVDFNHGATRQLMLDIAPEADFYLFLTQDAIPASTESFKILMGAFSDKNVGAAYGRQLPRHEATEIEAHARLFNYGPKDLIKSKTDIPRIGIKAAFISNSFAAYRRTALHQIGGFPKNVILSEDAYVAARMILEGWKIAYKASAGVYHSHNYTVLEEYRRYFDVGVFHASEPWVREQFGGTEGEGGRFVRSELRYLWKHAKLQSPLSIVRTGVKYFGYRLGTFSRYLPNAVNRACSMNRCFWAKHPKQ